MRLGLAAKFLLPVCAWIAAAAALLGWLLIERQSQEYLNLTKERGGSLVKFIAHDVWWGTALAPESEIESTAKNAQSWSDFLYLSVIDSKGNTLTRQGDFDLSAYTLAAGPSIHEKTDDVIHIVYSLPGSGRRVLDISCPIFFTTSGRSAEEALLLDSMSSAPGGDEGDAAEFAGRVHIGLDLSPVDEMTSQFTKNTFWIGSFTVAVGIAFMLLIVRFLLSPLAVLRNATKTIAEGDLAIRVPTQHVFKDELSELGDSFNQMVSHLSDARQSIEEYNKGLESLVERRTQEISRLQAFLQNILDSIPSAVAIFSQKFLIRYSNLEFNKTFDPGRGASSQNSLDDRIHIVHDDAFREQLDELNRDNFSQGAEFHANNKIYFYRLFRVQTGDELQTGVVIVDVTEERQLQRQLTQAEKLAGIGTLASGVAHEINNPLQGILGMAEAALDEEEIDLIKEYTQDIVVYAQQAGEIVKELSTYSRAARSDASMPINLVTVIKSALRMSQHANNYADINVRKELNDIPEVIANAGELQQVFVNLFNNAVHAMEEKGDLTIKTWHENTTVHASITDTGCGIPSENLTQIFEPFFTTKPPGKGTGLGLNVVYRIIEKYHGRIHVDSQVGSGSTFFIDLPAQKELNDENPVG
ncbi:MAG: HAMP domain-containing protein [bacterium]|nr:HAMP domain-containing protein [bacterium]